MDINELESFKLSDAVKFHKELNPRLWNEEKLDPEVRDQLLLIAEDFVEYLGLDNLKVEDVTISGSNAAYSYTPHSDLDLHILVDFNQLPNNPVYQELFTAKKTLYNDAHDITVREVPVELYVQDTNQVHTSLGEYSVVYDKWIRIPKKRKANFDEAATKAKYEKLGDLIELALKSRDPKRVKDTIDLVKRYRKAGLEKAGEFGPENLAFKAIRKQGLIQDLYDLKAELHGEKLSIEEDTGSIADMIKSSLGLKQFIVTEKGNDLYLDSIIVDKKDQGKGLGSKALEQLISYADQTGKRIVLTPGLPNKTHGTTSRNRLVKFYKQFGFKENKGRSIDYAMGAGKMYRDPLSMSNEDYDPNGPPPGPEFKPTMPAGTVRVDVSDVYDWYKLGQHISNMKGLGKHDFGQGPPSTILSFGDEDTEHKYIQDLEKTGLTTTDIDPVDPNQPKGMKRQKTDPTFNVNETDDRTAAVLKIQKHLNKKYGANLDLDGKLGPLTLKSINKFMPRAKKGLADEPNKTTAVQGKKVKVDETITDLQVYRNPSPKQLYRLTQRSAHKHMRGMYYNGDTYWWDANDAIHKQGAKYLGIPYDYQQRMEAAIDSVSDNYRVGGDDGVPQALIQKYDIENELVYEAKLAETISPDRIKIDDSLLLEASGQIDEIGFADALVNLSLPDHEIIDNSTLASTIGQKPVRIFKRGSSTLYFFATETNILALVLLDGTYLKAIKNFTNEKGMVYSLLNYIVSMEGLHINIAPSEPFTQEGFEWLLRLATNTHGLRLTTSDGNIVDTETLKREWNNSRLTKEPGRTGLVISESSEGWKQRLIENENSLMPFRIFEYSEQLAEASGYIPNSKQRNDPRWCMALTKDVRPDAIKKNAKAFGFKTSRAGIPPQARADGKVTEALISYSPEKKFINEKEEVQYVATTVRDWRIRAKVFETIASRNINESTNNYQTIRDRVMKSLVAFSTNKLKIGNNYIPVQINILRDSLLFYDVKGNSPAQEPAEFGTLVELSKDEAKIRINNKLYNYPIHIDSANLMMVTVFLDSAEKYDQLRMMVSLEFEQSMPPLKPADGKIVEDLMREFKTFLSESAQPNIGYHVTATKNLPIIQKDGIKADKRGNSYIWDSPEMAEWFMDFQNDEGHDRTILKIDMSGLAAKPDPEAEDMSEWSNRFKPGTDGGAWIISGPIPPNKIIG